MTNRDSAMCGNIARHLRLIAQDMSDIKDEKVRSTIEEILNRWCDDLTEEASAIDDYAGTKPVMIGDGV